MLERIMLASALLFANVDDTTTTTTIADSSITDTTTTDTSISNSDTTISDNGDITYEESEQEVIDTLKEWLLQFFDSNLVGFVINWAIDAGLITIIAGIYFKYRKYKAKSSQEIASEVKQQINEVLNASFKDLSKEQQEKIINVVNKLNSEIETLKKALVLAQDKTAEGKIALLNLINETTKEVEVIKEVEKVKEKVIEENNKEKEVNEKVKEKYKPVD